MRSQEPPPLRPPPPRLCLRGLHLYGLRLRDLASEGSAFATSASTTPPPRAPPLWPPPPRLRIRDFASAGSASTGLDLRASAMLHPTLVPKGLNEATTTARIVPNKTKEATQPHLFPTRYTPERVVRGPAMGSGPVGPQMCTVHVALRWAHGLLIWTQRRRIEQSGTLLSALGERTCA
ncbi:hypothetical protein Fmac_007582 [Flemingia macrophylla]|uniref:Uncharacterized protein n=1 Tax=Flemingia macrophylla TaxID=520843 RepID=A0ABD1MUZ8_9FABA